MTYLRILAAALIGLSFFISLVSASTITLGDISIDSGGAATADIILDSVPSQGIQGYTINLTISNPSIAEISAVTYPDAFSTLHDTTPVPFIDGHISGIDLTAEYMKGGAANIRLATVTVKGLSSGSTRLVATIRHLDGLNGDDLKPVVSITSPTVTVRGAMAAAVPVRIPGISAPPSDPDGNRIYEDLDGDGSVSFSDVTLFFNNYDWIRDNEPVSIFDFDGNGKIDFGDIISLNQKR